MLKKIFRIILLPALVFAIAVTVISCGKEEKMRQKADNIPQISDREGLEKALQGSPQMHACIKVPLTGEPVEDRFGILKDQCLYISYSGEEFSDRETVNPETGAAQSTNTWIPYIQYDKA